MTGLWRRNDAAGPRILPPLAVACLLALGMLVAMLASDWLTPAMFPRPDGRPAWFEARRLALVGGVSLVVFWLLRRREASATLDERSADARLRDLDERYRAIFDLAGLGISEVDLEGRFRRVNPALCRITGYTEEALLRMSGRDLTPPEDWPASLARMQAAIRGELPTYTMEKRYRRQDGSLLWVELTAVLARDREGRPDYFVTITQDSSARRAALAALGAGEARFRSLIDHMSTGLVQHAADGRIVACNRAAPALLGLTEDQILARAPMDPAWHTIREDGSTLPAEEHPSSIVLRTGAPVYNRIIGLHRPDGGLAWLQVSSAPYPGDEGEPHGAIVTFEDVTVERRALAALRASESRYRSVIETMDEAVLVFDASGRVIGSNPAATRVFGTDDDGIRRVGPAQPTLRLFDTEGRELAREQRPSYRALFRGERVSGAILKSLRPDGSAISLEINARPLSTEAGLPGGAVVVLADVTAREAARAELKALTETLERRVAERTAELSQLNRELESFAYSISHDLRAPLRGIAGFASLLAEEERDRLSRDGIELLERIAGNAERMGELIDDVLEYSRATRSDRRLEDVDLDRLVEEASAAGRTAHPDTAWHAGPLGHATGDAAMLRQVFDNLIGNAFKYSSRAAAPFVRVERQEEGGRIWYCVSDNGIGFDLRYADRLFGLFQRMHSDPAYPGTGVGLAIVKRLVERHGGTIEAWAEPDRGARFRFTLGNPATATPAATPS